MTPKNIRELAYKLAKSNNLQIPPTWSSEQIAGVDWYAGFMNWHPTLSIREPEPTSLPRINFNKVTVRLFFDNLSEVLSHGAGFGPQSIYNVDETGVVTVQKPRTIVAEKEVKLMTLRRRRDTVRTRSGLTDVLWLIGCTCRARSVVTTTSRRTPSPRSSMRRQSS